MRDIYKVVLVAKVSIGNFTNNFFDLLPGQSVTVIYETSKEVSDIKNIVKVYSLVDSY